MNYKLLFETFPQLTDYRTDTANKFIFQSEYGLLEVPKSQLTEQERTVLSIFLKPLPEYFDMQHLWMRFFTDESIQPPEDIHHFQLLKVVFLEPFHKINDLQHVLESIAGCFCYILPFDELTYGVLLVNGEEFINFTPFIALIEDDFKTSFTIMTTPLEQKDRLRESYQLLQSIPNEICHSDRKVVFELDEMILTKMLTATLDREREQFVSIILKESVAERTLLETVECYIQHICNFSQTAKALYIHRNTLQKRLERFEELSGRNLKSSDDLLKISIALKLYKMHTHSYERVAETPLGT
ncbi:hypothetical protein DCE79_10585 [Lysinibacillus sp. 2017]|uniref:PucR family transcriptional regulator n=1 Tax=unclassified Lysinibacillus TaxID=2636778 RepID=UPI000D5281D8|nr:MULTISPECIES: helix-turn-helix domain-containing protein [unclassified Lysinibacillus]AWE07803.1 hypothetical protein DCE79_10585 [Lysinibacillus sp. 2017]TGN34624.1 hypothetical protein E4L99_13940 [Lysinibacillus sp. S2017]